MVDLSRFIAKKTVPAKGVDDANGEGDKNEELVAQIKAQGSQIAQLATALQVIGGSVGTVMKEFRDLKAAGGGEKKETPNPDPLERTASELMTEEQIDEMKPSKLLGLIESRVGSLITGALEKHLKPVQEKVGEVENDTFRQRVSKQIEDTKAKYPDFEDFVAEIRQSVEKNPNLEMEDHYHLVKAKNPEKAAETAKKYAPAKEEDDESSKSFGGLMPTSGHRSGKDKVTYANPQEAALAAYDKVFGTQSTEQE